MTVKIVDKTGNLLESGADVLVNATNTRGVMGAGLALQFRERWPEMFAEYQQLAADNRLWTDLVHVWPNTAYDGPEAPVTEAYEPSWIVNLHTKRDPSQPSRYLYVVSGLIDLVDHLTDELEDALTVAVPALGCGLGGLDWRVVEPLIRDVLGEAEELNDGAREDLEVWLYAPR